MGSIDWKDLGQKGSEAFDSINASLKEILTYDSLKKTVDSLKGLAGDKFEEACKKVGGAVKEDDKLECDITFNNKAYKYFEKVAGIDADDENDVGTTPSSDGIVTHVSIGLIIYII